MSESALDQVELSENHVLELIAPKDWGREFGRGDTFSDYLYRPMVESGKIDRFIAFVNMAENYIDTQDIDSQLNHEKIQRIFVLAHDLPEEIPEDERLKAWEHILAADWIHMYCNIGDLGIILASLTEENPVLAVRVSEVAKRVLQAKRADFTKRSPNIVLPQEAASNTVFMDGYDQVKAKSPELLPQYNAIACLNLEINKG